MTRLAGTSSGNSIKGPVARTGQRGTAARKGKRNREELKRVVVEALRKEFPTDTVDVSDGYKENLHVLVVSRKFDGMSERQKQDMLRSLLKAGGLSKPEQDLVSVLLPFSPAELK
jgi:stress-induced morphogen